MFNNLAIGTSTMKAETKLNVQAPKAVVHHTKSWFKTVFSSSPVVFKEIKRKLPVFFKGGELFKNGVERVLVFIFGGGNVVFSCLLFPMLKFAALLHTTII